MQMNILPTRCLAFMILLAVLVGGPTSLWALTLGEAKAKGLVGETLTGYLGIVSGKGSTRNANRNIRALPNVTVPVFKLWKSWQGRPPSKKPDQGTTSSFPPENGPKNNARSAVLPISSVIKGER